MLKKCQKLHTFGSERIFTVVPPMDGRAIEVRTNLFAPEVQLPSIFIH